MPEDTPVHARVQAGKTDSDVPVDVDDPLTTNTATAPRPPRESRTANQRGAARVPELPDGERRLRHVETELEDLYRVLDMAAHLLGRRTTRALDHFDAAAATPQESSDDEIVSLHPTNAVPAGVPTELYNRIRENRAVVLDLVGRLAPLVDEVVLLEAAVFRAVRGTADGFERAAAATEIMGLQDAFDAIAGLASHVAERVGGVPNDLAHELMHELTGTAHGGVVA